MDVKLTLLSLLVIGSLAAPEGQKDVNVKNIARQSKLGFLGTTTNTLAQLAQDLIARSTTSSQVLSLNLTNLVILLVVKALIFGAGSLGFGGHDSLGRSLDDPNEINPDNKESFVTQSELLLIMSYLKGELTHKYSCLNFAACQDPAKAKQYLLASNFLFKGVNMFNLSSERGKYEKILLEVDDAIKFGDKGNDCSIRYTCEGDSYNHMLL